MNKRDMAKTLFMAVWIAVTLALPFIPTGSAETAAPVKANVSGENPVVDSITESTEPVVGRNAEATPAPMNVPPHLTPHKSATPEARCIVSCVRS